MELQPRSADKKPNRLRRGLLAMTAAAGLLIAACTSDSTVDTTAHDKAATCLNGDLSGRSVSRDMAVEGSPFKVRATYATDYDVSAWRITDSKTLDIKLELVPTVTGAEAPTVLIDNLHADATIKATKTGVNGLKQDSFDDHIHAGDQPGFELSAEHPYTEQFVIEGYSEMLTQAWGYMAGSYGSFDMDTKRLNEDNLRKQGAYGEEISMVTDLLIKDTAADPYFHKTVVSDTLIIPLEGKSCPA